jgi:hypothetical protein
MSNNVSKKLTRIYNILYDYECDKIDKQEMLRVTLKIIKE